MLVMGAAFGAVVGLVGALLIELLARRVRGMEDLESTIEAPVLAIVSNEEPRGGWLRKWLNPREPDGIAPFELTHAEAAAGPRKRPRSSPRRRPPPRRSRRPRLRPREAWRWTQTSACLPNRRALPQKPCGRCAPRSSRAMSTPGGARWRWSRRPPTAG